MRSVGRVQHLGAAARERVDEVGRAAVARDADAEALELVGPEPGRALDDVASRGDRREAGRALHELGRAGVAVVREAHDLADDDDRGRGDARRARRRRRCR